MTITKAELVALSEKQMRPNWVAIHPLITNLMAFDYVNHKGQTYRREVAPKGYWFGKSPFHPTPQWFLYAFDMDKQETRDFAMADMKNVEFPMPAKVEAVRTKPRKHRSAIDQAIDRGHPVGAYHGSLTAAVPFVGKNTTKAVAGRAGLSDPK